MRVNRMFSVLAAMVLLCCGQAVAADVAARTAALNTLLDEQWQWQLREAPDLAVQIGDYRYNDRWADLSLQHLQQQRRDLEAFQQRAQAIDSAGMSDSDQLNAQILLRTLDEALQELKFKNEEMPLDQFNGLHLLTAQLVDQLPFDSTRHYQDYLVRLQHLPQLLDQITALARQGMKDGLMPPRYLLDVVVQQCADIAAKPGADNVFSRPVARFPDAVPAADRIYLRNAVIATVDAKVRPAYQRLAAFVKNEYAPHGRKNDGIWSLPDGDARYRFAIRVMTTTDMAPDRIHALGLSEVARIEGEMNAIAHRLGYADWHKLHRAMLADPKLHAQSREQLVDLYRHDIEQMQARLPSLFGLLPKTPMQVQPTQAYREKGAAGAEYEPGTADGSRPGMVYVNTGDVTQRTLFAVEATAYHEGVPGHHLQSSIAQSLTALPPQRRYAGYNAYVEGWALYSEQLGKDVGFYQDPYSDFGRLNGELLRANRLVLDTGVHYLHWTRAQMVQYFREHSAEDETDIQAETDRYIVWPAQALAYKLGQLKFLEMRERARTTLKDRFDIRSFHDQMLDGGALPLDLLEARFNHWLQVQTTQ